MNDPGKRVIVDGVEFSKVWSFPAILRAITSAMQPSRMLMALFMVILLLTAGRLWDRFTEPTVHPQGLREGRIAMRGDDIVHQDALRAALMTFAPQHTPPADAPPRTTLSTSSVRTWVASGYRDRRAAAETESERQMLDMMYEAQIERIEATRPLGDFEATATHLGESLQMIRRGVVDLSPRETLRGLDSALIETPRALWRDQTWFAVIFGLITLVVLAVGGGAIARIAAVQQSNDARTSLGEATDFAVSRWPGLVWALGLPLLLLGILAGVVFVLGALMRVPVLDVLTALFYGLILLLGFLMAFIIIAYVVGLPLLVPAVACDNSDGADAMQRTFAYVANKPLHAIWYWIVGLAGLAIGLIIVTALALLTLNLTGSLFGWLAPAPVAAVAGGYEGETFAHAADTAVTGNWHQRWSANIILVWQALVICLVAAYVISYIFSAGTIAYLLMRKASDGQEMDEVWRPGLIPGTLAPEPPPLTVGTLDSRNGNEPPVVTSPEP